MKETGSGLLDLASLAAEATTYVFIIVNWFKLRYADAHPSTPPLVSFLAALAIVPMLLLYRGYINPDMGLYAGLQTAAGVGLISLLVMGTSAGVQTITNRATAAWDSGRDK